MIAVEYIPLDKRIRFKTTRAAERREWLERAHLRNPRCHYCKNATELKPRDYNQMMRHHEEMVATLDHAVPTSNGGADHPKNWRLACAICNALKSDRSEREFIEELREAGVR